MTPTHAELDAALETVRKGDKDFTAVSPQEWYAATELLARWLAENAERLRVVKPLGEWEQVKPWVRSDLQEWRLQTPFGWCRVREDAKGVFSCNGCGGVVIGPCDSLADGKAKAQAWYDERIAAALSPAFPAKEENNDAQ